MRKIKTIRNILIHVRTWIKILIIFIIATLIIISTLFFIYKPTYQVILDGKTIGYTDNKSQLQKKINEYIENGNDEKVEFVQFEKLPTYKMCLLKKDIECNDDEIYSTITSEGIKYYKYYAITQDGEEKKYLDEFTNAESVITELRNKKSTNIDNLGIVEKYDVELKEFSNVDNCVDELYVKPAPKVTTPKSTKYSSAVNLSGGTNASGNKIELGIAFINPTSGIISSRFGPRSRNNHKGLDIAAPNGTPIKAAASGTVVYAGYNSSGYGYHVIISHSNGVQTLYGHCSSLDVSEGESVSQGQVIAKVGSTGRSTGNHLHFEIRLNGVAQDPEPYIY